MSPVGNCDPIAFIYSSLRPVTNEPFHSAHIISQLLERGHKVVTTVRSKEEEQVVRDAHKDSGKDNIEFVIVPDMVVKGAFDEAAQIEGLGAVLHIASPFFYDFGKFTYSRMEF